MLSSSRSRPTSHGPHSVARTHQHHASRPWTQNSYVRRPQLLWSIGTQCPRFKTHNLVLKHRPTTPPGTASHSNFNIQTSDSRSSDPRSAALQLTHDSATQTPHKARARFRLAVLPLAVLILPFASCLSRVWLLRSHWLSAARPGISRLSWSNTVSVQFDELRASSFRLRTANFEGEEQFEGEDAGGTTRANLKASGSLRAAIPDPTHRCVSPLSGAQCAYLRGALKP